MRFERYVGLRLELDQWRLLARHAEQAGLSVSEYVRRLIDQATVHEPQGRSGRS